jgi:hypothetical protein
MPHETIFARANEAGKIARSGVSLNPAGTAEHRIYPFRDRLLQIKMMKHS